MFPNSAPQVLPWGYLVAFYWMRPQQTRFNLLIRPKLLRLDTATA